MTDSNRARVPLLLWPFYALWRLLTLILKIAGRLVCALLGMGIIIAGVAVTMSVVGAPLGIPLVIVGILLIVRAIF